MLTAQLKWNPLYPTTWQNDRNITNQKGEGIARELLRDPESSLVPWPRPPTPSTGWSKASICGIIDPLDGGLGTQISLF